MCLAQGSARRAVRRDVRRGAHVQAAGGVRATRAHAVRGRPARQVARGPWARGRRGDAHRMRAGVRRAALAFMLLVLSSLPLSTSPLDFGGAAGGRRVAARAEPSAVGAGAR